MLSRNEALKELIVIFGMVSWAIGMVSWTNNFQFFFSVSFFSHLVIMVMSHDRDPQRQMNENPTVLLNQDLRRFQLFYFYKLVTEVE